MFPGIAGQFPRVVLDVSDHHTARHNKPQIIIPWAPYPASGTGGVACHDVGNQGDRTDTVSHHLAFLGLSLPPMVPVLHPPRERGRTCACLDSFLARVRITEHAGRISLASLVAWPAARYVSVRAWCRNVSMLTEMSDRVAIMPGGVL